MGINKNTIFLFCVLFAGQKLVVVVNDITSAMEVLVKKGTDFAGRPTAPSGKILKRTERLVPFPRFQHLILSWQKKKHDLLVPLHMLTAFNENKNGTRDIPSAAGMQGENPSM